MIKIFTKTSSIELENELNIFLKENEVDGLHYSISTADGVEIYFSCMVNYGNK